MRTRAVRQDPKSRFFSAPSKIGRFDLVTTTDTAKWLHWNARFSAVKNPVPSTDYPKHRVLTALPSDDLLSPLCSPTPDLEVCTQLAQTQNVRLKRPHRFPLVETEAVNRHELHEDRAG